MFPMGNKKMKRYRKNRRNFVAIPFTLSQGLSTLADDALLEIALTAVFGEDIYIISVDALIQVRDFAAGDTPLRFGYAHSDLTTGEIVEALDAELINPDDIIQKERARRPVRKVGQISAASEDSARFNNGNMKRTPIKFSVGEGFNLAFWIRNQSGQTLTTGAVLEVDGIIYGRWQR